MIEEGKEEGKGAWPLFSLRVKRSNFIRKKIIIEYKPETSDSILRRKL